MPPPLPQSPRRGGGGRPPGSTPRLFIAVGPGDGAVRRLGAMIAALRGVQPRARWVDAEQSHLTLAFLGEVPADREAPAREALAAAAAAAPFELALGGAGAFPSWERPRVVWLGVALGADRLAEIERALRSELGARGFPLEERDFHPHLTLCRLDVGRSDGGCSALRREAERWADPAAWRPTSVRVTELELMQSSLSAKGPSYATRHRQELRP